MKKLITDIGSTIPEEFVLSDAEINKASRMAALSATMKLNNHLQRPEVIAKQKLSRARQDYNTPEYRAKVATSLKATCKAKREAEFAKNRDKLEYMMKNIKFKQVIDWDATLIKGVSMAELKRFHRMRSEGKL